MSHRDARYRFQVISPPVNWRTGGRLATPLVTTKMSLFLGADSQR